ncbi:micrococcal nuclease [Mariniphaga anaerophila]|uniref:Micrococcal nuclease n=1 Tax=Mariniphaga anaerophila TaxID=1484053 RepID=A0A1M5F5T3_9BACT|nr:thermonuclease family protein [Mariniphaga anaerophila]SHF86970.1 micrococcal nuclease [Mariniphaga anaerophila]
MYQYKATVDYVVDGDTLDITIDLGFKITTHQRIRLADINTPEIFSVKKDSEEHKRGMAAKQYVEKRLADNDNKIVIETEKNTGKYGRYIGTIFLADSDITLNEELVKEGHALKVKY